jgi:hypothetical protein
MGNLNYKVIDNFLEEKTHKDIQNVLMSPDFPWYFQKSMTGKDSNIFSHSIFKEHLVMSPFYELMSPFLIKMECKALSEIRLNLSINKYIQESSNWHVDRFYKCFTSIFYVNTNNGYTLIDKDKKIKIESKENRMLIFDSQIKHMAVLQTDVERRIVINFNFFQ